MIDELIAKFIEDLKNKYVWAPLIIITLIIVFILFFKMVVPALHPSDKGPTSVIVETQNGDFWREVVSDEEE